MPIQYLQKFAPSIEIGVWDITEDEAYFVERLKLSSKEDEQLSKLSGIKRTEWLAVRQLLHQMSGRETRALCLKDEFGKPYLPDSEYHISMSHTRKKAAVIASLQNVGIDIQYRVEKITRIAHKFVNEKEAIFTAMDDVDLLHVMWGAKECLYKAYGRRKLDFRTHIHIQNPILQKDDGYFSGQVIAPDNTLIFQLQYQWIDEAYCMVYAWEVE